MNCDHLYYTNWSEKKMEEDEASLTIVESLRGRLLAERAASKAAKLDEHLMDSKLKELQGQLKRETKARKRFEKKLSSLKNKLQSLKLPNPHILEEVVDSEESRSSSFEDASDSSCISSIASTQTFETPSDELHTSQQCPSQESASSDTYSPSLKHEMEDDTRKSQEEESEVDNSMALVPLSLPEEQTAIEEVVKISSESVREVLGTLKHIREEIQRTMQRRQATRQMIQVG